jgi:hypothetical protein
VEEALLLLLLSRASGRDGEETVAGTAEVHVRARAQQSPQQQKRRQRRRDKATSRESLLLFLSLSSPRTLI